MVCRFSVRRSTSCASTPAKPGRLNFQEAHALQHGEATHLGTFVALSFLRWRLIEVWWRESFWLSLCWVHAFGPCVCKVHACVCRRRALMHRACVATAWLFVKKVVGFEACCVCCGPTCDVCFGSYTRPTCDACFGSYTRPQEKKNRVVPVPRRASRYREASVVDLPPCRTKGYDVLVVWTYTNESTALAYKISFWIDR